MEIVSVPELLETPPKFHRIMLEFNDWRLFLLEGGRGSGKTQSVARFLLYLGDQKKLRIMCGRETHVSVELSVYTELKDIIEKYDLDYDILRDRITHRITGTTFNFRGFREKGRLNIKGISGMDILWVDEAQELKRNTVDIVIPTFLRKKNSRIIFTMNRFLNDDAVYDYCTTSDMSLVIKMNIMDNPFATDELKQQAEETKRRNLKDYAHIWLGEPLPAASDLLMTHDAIQRAVNKKIIPTHFANQRVMGIDFAAQGDDMCVATVIDRLSNTDFGVTSIEAWNEPEASHSIGKIVTLIGKYKPDVTMLDVGGMGTVVFSRLKELNIPNLHPFDGGGGETGSKSQFVNRRAEAYFYAKQMIEDGYIALDRDICKQVIHELGKIKFRYRSSGQRIIWSKQELKKPSEIGYSPDYADSFVMAVYALKLLGKEEFHMYGGSMSTTKTVERKVGNRVDWR